MITNPNPIAAVYNSKAHCTPCAEEKFGQSLYDRETPDDDHGEPVSFIFDHNYEPREEGEYCECGREIAPPTEIDPEDLLRELWEWGQSLGGWEASPWRRLER